MSLRHLNYEDEDEEAPTSYGTPFPPSLEETNAPKKTEVDLTVRDEQGRRRFHGAFTGGFSAGYFNTVGSKEGWVPAQFKSSRNSGKWSRDLVKGKPEDYMDDEDLNIFGITPRTVQTTDQFSGDVTKGLFAGFRDPSAPSKSISQVLEDVIKPVKLSIGLKLYKKMKRPQIKEETETTAETEQQDSGSKVYGCILPPGLRPQDSDDEEDDPNFSIDSYVLPFNPKNDFHGLGYQGINKNDPLIDSTISSVSANLGGRKLKITGEAFGIGALSDEDDLDEDAIVYGTDDLNNYDFAIGSNKQHERKTTKNTSLLALTDSSKLSDIFQLENTSSNSGLLVKSSFKSKYLLPELPRHFRPRPPWTSKLASSAKRSRWDSRDGSSSGKNFDSDKWPSDDKSSKNVVSESRNHGTVKNRGPVMDANVRGLLLGEEVINIKQKSDGGSTSVLGTKVQFVTSDREEKRSQDNSCPSSIDNSDLSSNVIAKPSPLFGYFASKFTHSSDPVAESQLGETKLDPGLTRSEQIIPLKGSSSKKEGEDTKKEEVNVGSCCRISYQWHPHKLVSRRFNVPVAYPQFPDVVGVVLVGKYAENIRNRTSLVTQSSTSSSSSNRVPSSSTFAPSSSLDHSKSQQMKSDEGRNRGDESLDSLKRDEKALNEQKSEVRSFQNEKKEKNLFQTENEMEDQVQATINTTRLITSTRMDQMDAEEETRPPIDLFRAIFASDEEKDTNSEDEDKTEGKDESREEKRDKKEEDLMGKASGKSFEVQNDDGQREDSRTSKSRRDRDDDCLDWKEDSSSSSHHRSHHHTSRLFEEADDSRRRKRTDRSERKERDSRQRHEKKGSRKEENRSDCRNDHDPSRDGWALLNETTRSDQTYESEGKRKDCSKTRDRRHEGEEEKKSSDEGGGERGRGEKNKRFETEKKKIEGGNISGSKSMNSYVSTPSRFSSSNLVEESFSRSCSSIGTSKLHSFIRHRVKEPSTLCDTISVTNVASSVERESRNLNKQEIEGHQKEDGEKREEVSVKASSSHGMGERRWDINDTGLNDRLSSPATRSTGSLAQRTKENGREVVKKGLVSVSHGGAGESPADIENVSRMKGHLHNLGADSSTMIRSEVSSLVIPTETSGFNEANLCEDENEDELYGPSLPPSALDTIPGSSASDHYFPPMEPSLNVQDVKQKLEGKERLRKRSSSVLVSSDGGATRNDDHKRKDRSSSSRNSSTERGRDRKKKKGKYKKKRKRSKERKRSKR